MSQSVRGQPTKRLRGIVRAARGTSAGPVFSIVVLAIVAILSLGLLGGPGPGLVTAKATGDPGDVPNRTPDPVKVFVPPSSQMPRPEAALRPQAYRACQSNGDSDVTS